MGKRESSTGASSGIARALTRRLEAVSEVKQRSHLIAQYCEVNEPSLAARGLDEVMIAAIDGVSRDAWLAVVIALFQESIPYRVLESIYRAAFEDGLDALRIVLLAGDHTRRTAKESEFARDDLLESTPLGRRKAQARQSDVPTLLRLLHDPNETVIRILLGNSRVTEDMVLRLASKRPNRVRVLHEISIAPRWVCRAAIQRGLVLNPYTPVKISASLIPLLGEASLREISEDKNLHTMVVTMARTVLRMHGYEPPVFH